MTTEYILGLDLSLTAPGMAMVDGVEVLEPKSAGVVRLQQIRDWVLLGAGARTKIAVIEGYSYASKFSRAHSLGELGGVVKVALVERGVDLHIVEPNVLKLFALGKGGGKGTKKNDMLRAALAAGYAEETSDDNAIDAWWLRQFGLFADAFYEVPQTQYRHGAVGTWLTKREAA